MTLILIVDPIAELLIHSVHIFDKKSKNSFDAYFRGEQIARGHALDRILVREKYCTIMDPGDEVPVPVEMVRSCLK